MAHAFAPSAAQVTAWARGRVVEPYGIIWATSQLLAVETGISKHVSCRLSLISIYFGAGGQKDGGCIATAASDGSMRLWALREIEAASSAAQPMAETHTDARLTCMCCLDSRPDQAISKKSGNRKEQQREISRLGTAKKQKQENGGETDMHLGIGVLLPGALASERQKHVKQISPMQRQVGKERGKETAVSAGTIGKGDSKRKALAADGSVVRHGVVEFPDVASKKKRKKKKK